jgi:hypothetical protein
MEAAGGRDAGEGTAIGAGMSASIKPGGFKCSADGGAAASAAARFRWRYALALSAGVLAFGTCRAGNLVAITLVAIEIAPIGFGG